MAGAEGPSPHWRVGDAEREAAAERVRCAAGEGRLTLDEAGDRLGAVAAASTAGELAAVVADLPPGTGTAGALLLPAAGPPRRRGGRGPSAEPLLLAASTATAAGAGLAGAGAWAAAPVVLAWAWTALRRR